MAQALWPKGHVYLADAHLIAREVCEECERTEQRQETALTRAFLSHFDGTSIMRIYVLGFFNMMFYKFSCIRTCFLLRPVIAQDPS